MDSITLDQTMPVSALQRDYNEVIERAKKSKESIVLTKHNKPIVRILSESVYRQLKKFQRMYEEEKLLQIIARGEKDYKAGKLLSSNDISLTELIGYEEK